MTSGRGILFPVGLDLPSSRSNSRLSTVRLYLNADAKAENYLTRQNHHMNMVPQVSLLEKYIPNSVNEEIVLGFVVIDS